MNKKILPIGACAEPLADLRRAGRKIVLCHGTFDLLHPGHLKHLEDAKRYGDVLVVSLTAARHVNKGPGRPVFGDEQRAYQLAHLAIVDHVVVVPFAGAVEIIEAVRPDVYCKGTEYASPANETDRRVEEDAEAVKRCGGKVVFVGEPLHSSTQLVATHLDALDTEVREYLESIAARDALDQIDPALARIANLRVLVVGDLIIDRYTYGRVQGLTAKAKVISFRHEREEDHLGGGLAIARHIASFRCKSVKYMALAGKEPWLDAALAPLESAVGLELVRSGEYQSVLKQRYVERPGKRLDLVKLFAVNRMTDTPPAAMKAELLARLEEQLAQADLVVVCDYGHGLIDADVQKLLEAKSSWLALNCQTNSNNYGFNLITKYKRADLFSLDETELRLAAGSRQPSEFDVLSDLSRRLQARQGWLTLGSSGSIVHAGEGRTHSCPAMVKSTVDTVGAGDAFFAAAALCGRVDVPLELSSILANLSGAIAANIVGNKEPVRSEAIVKNARYLLKSARAERRPAPSPHGVGHGGQSMGAASAKA